MRDRRGTMRIFCLVVSLCLWLSPAVADEPAEREFATGVAGSRPQDPKFLPETYFKHRQVRALIFRMEAGPLSREDVEAALAGTDFAVEDLLRIKILDERGGLYFIGFNYFTRKDMKAIYAAADKYVPKMVEAYLRRKPDFDAIFAQYEPAGVSKDYLAFVLIAGMSLNWDGLKILEEAGYRRPNLVEGELETGERWKYSFYAAELLEERSTRSYFYASSTFPGGPFNFETDPLDYSFSSYGDPYSNPRMNFPDLLYLPLSAMTPDIAAHAEQAGLRNENFFGNELTNIIGLERARSIGAILFALREGPQTAEALRAAVPQWDRAAVDDLLAVLEEVQYAERLDNGAWRLRAPVLDAEDAAMVDAALALSRDVMTTWADRHYAEIRADLNDLTALRHGVAFESLFTQIWHEIFGLATKRLVEQGFFADPYGDGVNYKGSLGMVWRASLYDFDPR